MRLINGSNLDVNQRTEVKAAFVHWQGLRIRQPVYWHTWEEWLEAHAFWFAKSGRLAKGRKAQPAWRAKP